MAIKSVGVSYATANASDKEIAEFFDWCVERGAVAYEGVRGASHSITYKEFDCPEKWDHFGVAVDKTTGMWHGVRKYGSVVATIEEAKDIIDPAWRKQAQKEEEMTDEQKAKKRVLEIVEKVLDGDILYVGYGEDEAIANDHIHAIYQAVWRATHELVLKSERDKEKKEKEAKRKELEAQISSLLQQLEAL